MEFSKEDEQVVSEFEDRLQEIREFNEELLLSQIPRDGFKTCSGMIYVELVYYSKTAPIPNDINKMREICRIDWMDVFLDGWFHCEPLFTLSENGQSLMPAVQYKWS